MFDLMILFVTSFNSYTKRFRHIIHRRLLNIAMYSVSLRARVRESAAVKSILHCNDMTGCLEGKNCSVKYSVSNIPILSLGLA